MTDQDPKSGVTDTLTPLTPARTRRAAAHAAPADPNRCRAKSGADESSRATAAQLRAQIASSMRGWRQPHRCKCTPRAPSQRLRPGSLVVLPGGRGADRTPVSGCDVGARRGLGHGSLRGDRRPAGLRPGRAERDHRPDQQRDLQLPT
jgi:hypothetical protein